MSFFATCVYLRRNLRAVWPPNASLYASSTCVHLRLLASPFGQGFKITQDYILSPGQTATQVDASWRLGSTFDFVWPGLACNLRWLAMTCAHFGRDQICTQVDASFSSFGHPTQVNASWVTAIIIQISHTVRVPIFWLVGLYNVTLGCDNLLNVIIVV